MSKDRWFDDIRTVQESLKLLGVSENEYRELAVVVSDYFPDHWVQKELADKKPSMATSSLYPPRFWGCDANPLIYLLGRGAPGSAPVSCIVQLGRWLKTWLDVTGSTRVVSRLRGDCMDFLGALFEMEVLHTLIAGGCNLIGPPEQDGVDFTLEKSGSVIFVEATHRGADADMVFERDVMGLAHEEKVNHAKRSASRTVRVEFYYSTYLTERISDYEGLVKRLVTHITDASSGRMDGMTADSKGAFTIHPEQAPQASVVFDWLPGTNDIEVYVHSAAEMLARKVFENKVVQIRRNEPTYLAVNVRSIAVPVEAKGDTDTYSATSKFIRRFTDLGHKFLSCEPTVNGLLLWMGKGLVESGHDHMIDDSEIVLIREPSRLAKHEAASLFPFATEPEDLVWFDSADG